MSELRRKIVRLSIFILPSFLLLAALHVTRDDLRDAASSFLNSGYTIHGNVFHVRGKARAEALGQWTHKAIRDIRDDDRIYGFKEPKSGFRIKVRSEAGPSECESGSNEIVIRGIPDSAPVTEIHKDLSRLIARAMLRFGAPDAAFSPWFEEGVSRFYEGTEAVGSRNDDLIKHAALNAPPSLQEALDARGGDYFHAISHSITAFLHYAYSHDVVARYAAIEREPGPVPPGEFQRIFGADVEKAWRDFLERWKKGS